MPELKIAPDNFDIEDLFCSALENIEALSLPTMYSLLKCTEIKISRDLPTLAIAHNARGGNILHINPDFVFTFASTPLAFTGVLLHEMFHDMFRHIDFLESLKTPKYSMLWNIAMDAIINSIIYNIACTYHKDIIQTFRKYYSWQVPELLLKPPDMIRRNKTRELKAITQQNIKNLYERLYLYTINSTPTEEEVFNFLRSLEIKADTTVKFIGNHDDKNTNDKQKQSQEDRNSVSDEQSVQDIIDEVSHSIGYSRLLNKLKKDIKKSKSSHLATAVELALLNSTKAKIIGKLGVPDKPGRSVIIPSQIGRSDLVKLSSGMYPTFFVRHKANTKPVECSIYIDVSGSVLGYVDWMYGCITDMTRIADIKPYLFSTKVVPTTMGNIKNGNIETSGGTSFNCVLEHILDNNVKKAVLFTDGYAYAESNLISRVTKENILIIAALIDARYLTSSFRDLLKKFCKVLVEVPRKDDST